VIVSSLSPSHRKLYLSASIQFGTVTHPFRAFVDNGSESSFIHPNYIKLLKIPLVRLNDPIKIVLASGEPVDNLTVTHKTIPLQLHIRDHIETISLMVCDLNFDLLLGYDWLARHDPHITWSSKAVSFASDYYKDNCIKVASKKPIQPNESPETVASIHQTPAFESVSIESVPVPESVSPESVIPVLPSDYVEEPVAHVSVPEPLKITAESGIDTGESVFESEPPVEVNIETKPTSISVCAINWSAAEILLKDEHASITPGFLHLESDGTIAFSSLANISSAVYPFMEPSSSKCEEVPVLPAELKDFGDVFSKQASEQLPPHREHDCVVDLEPGAIPSCGRVYSLTKEEDAVLKEWLNENLTRGFIRESNSPFGAPCFFVRKPDWTGDSKLRLCMDYRALNKVTVKDRHPIPLISEMIRSLSVGKVFTTLDLRGAYNLLRMKEGEESKTAFVTKYGQYEFLVMPFGLANAPAQFQRMMNRLFQTQLKRNFVLVYLDDVVIYSQNKEEHWLHVREVLEILRQNQLYCKLEKCHFAKEVISYLGYVISKDGVSMDPRKVKAIKDWPAPKNVKELQMFLGFVNFYRRFIIRYAQKTTLMTALLKKEVAFAWSASIDQSFEELKNEFTHAGILAYPDESQPFVLEVDASDFGVAGVLSQYDANQDLRPVAFYSRQMIPAERNYEIYDKELLAIHECFREWRHLLQGAQHRVTVLTDHNNLKYFMSTKQLTRRQARWAEFMAEFDFVLTHRPGSLNARADLLSRRPDYYVEVEKSNFITLLKPHQIAALQSPTLGLEIDESEDWPLLIADYLISGTWLPEISPVVLSRCQRELKHFRLKEHQLMRVMAGQREAVPYLRLKDRIANMKRFHDGLGHLKFGSIKEAFQRRYWWPNLEGDFKSYIATCPRCQLDESATGQHHHVPIRPVPPVAQPFERWGIDFVQDLPVTKSGNRHIITAIDYATRWVVMKAVPNRSAESVAEFLYSNILMNYGAPFEIISDRASAILSEGIREYESLQGIRHFATTPAHPQTNGMVERMHSMLGHAITTLVQGKTDRWDEYLDQTMFALRVRTHAVTKHAPFYLLYGVHPRIPGDTTPLASSMQPLDEIEQMEEQGEFNARTFEALGDARGAAYERSKYQAEAMRKRYNLNPDSPDYYFEVGDMVKLKHFGKTKFEFDWRGPYYVVDVGFPGTYWLMTPDGRRFDSTVNESDLAPWRQPVESDRSYFYDGRHGLKRGDTVTNSTPDTP
jgi:transposase InsO family protein